jgi:hypothetical protein
MIKDVEINFEINIQHFVFFFFFCQQNTRQTIFTFFRLLGLDQAQFHGPWQSHEFSTFFPVIIMRVAFAETIRKLWLDLDKRFSQGNAIHVHDHPRKDLYILEVKAQK